MTTLPAPNTCTPLAAAAFQEMLAFAEDIRSEFITPEHLLYVLIKQDVFIDYCDKMNIDFSKMLQELNDYLRDMDTLLEDEEADFSISLQKIVERVTELNEQFGELINIIDLFVAIDIQAETKASFLIKQHLGENPGEWFEALFDHYLFDTDSKPITNQKTEKKKGEKSAERPSVKVVKPKITVHASQGAPVDDEIIHSLLNNILSQAGKNLGSSGNVDFTVNIAEMQRGGGATKKQGWEKFVTNVSETYRTHNILVGREEELDLTIQVLCQKDQNNPLHIGESGVGKTALVYGLARRIAEGNVPSFLKEATIYMLDMGTLIAGTSFHGEFEQRIKELMEGMKKQGNCICYIDDMHNIMNSSSGNNAMDASTLLKSYLEEGSIRFIGSTTFQDYNKHLAKSKGIVRRFQQIEIQEPSMEDTLKILEGIIPSYEKFHGVKYDKDAITYAVEQSARLITNRYFPEKAISIIDRAGAYRKTHPLQNKDGKIMSAGRQRIDRKVIQDILTKVCKINAKSLTQHDNSELKNLSANISSQLYGQPEAIEKVVRAVKLSKAGLVAGDKPLASLLFVGPTGVGKTELCKVLAKELGIPLVRFDMSEYTEKHTVAKLIGSPAGYVGYEDGGLLSDAIRKSPNCVLLLDEIEKAHEDIYNILLQIMDYATLTDNRGNKIDFQNVILIMTSNAGAQYADQASIGFGGGTTKGEAMLQTVKKTFKPEFLNRLSGTVVFHDMDKQMASLILDKKLRQLAEMLTKKSVTLKVSERAHQWLLEQGYSQQYGAREMDRVIQEHLTTLLMDEILFGKLQRGGNVTISEKDGKLFLK